MFRIAREGWIVGLAVLLVSCADTRHERLVDLGFTRNYLDGYQDGCSSRKEEAQTHLDGFRRDPERMVVDKKYANGWTDGFEQCYADNSEFY
ncbi:hypothetical protein MD588_05880 [Photobacterium sp. SDRW27]|uniref:hypothetical protein n=1 Tax=Photobacterium obscurum TaxID=2829490 RepID=UPI00224405DA|nr:hypothetical protein [Photobacterium obscurum]MCW8328334.1 hypothetical protein [Photobacterium obscurum]